MPLPHARLIADELVELLAPACSELHIAGSIRRRAPTVGDLELVALSPSRPVGQVGLFGGQPAQRLPRLWELVDLLVDEHGSGVRRGAPKMVRCPACKGLGGMGDVRCDRCLTLGQVERAAPWGDRWRRLQYRDVPVDLFLADEDSLGAQLLIRTGPASYSRAWVTEIRRHGWEMRGGWVRSLADDSIVPVATVAQAARLAGWPWIEPEEREAWVQAYYPEYSSPASSSGVEAS